ncbi:MAG: L,D-transpeptidase family protein [Phycisphaerales bacterium]
MAVSYGNNRNKVVVYYVVIGLVIIAAAIFIFYPHKKNKAVDEPNINTAIQQTQPLQTPSQNTNAVAPGTAVTPPANSTNPRAAAMIADAQNCINEGKVITARNTLNDVLNMSLDPTTRETIKKQMTALSNEWLFTRVIQLGDDLCSTYRVQPGDKLTFIAQSHKIPYKLLMRINNIQNERSLRAGQTLKVLHGPFHAVAYKSAYTMDLYLQNIYVKSYKIGIGKDGHETPVGLWRTKVGGKMIKPTWTDPETGHTFHADDPNYPLGSGWIALDGIDNRTRGIQGIAIHGTKDEDTIGTKSSLGCVRLYNGELMEVYDLLEPGYSEVRIVE